MVVVDDRVGVCRLLVVVVVVAKGEGERFFFRVKNRRAGEGEDAA